MLFNMIILFCLIEVVYLCIQLSMLIVIIFFVSHHFFWPIIVIPFQSRFFLQDTKWLD